MKNSKFESNQSLIFGLIYLLIALFSFVGFLTGRLWCIYPTVLSAILTFFFMYEFQKSKNEQK